eukprot:6030970-Alexandrium_andersonii.AAC.1
MEPRGPQVALALARMRRVCARATFCALPSGLSASASDLVANAQELLAPPRVLKTSYSLYSLSVSAELMCVGS